mmetsp:Transcript_32599/g.28858  ORF Transcript_32599/g.28858 Transcript_32599/m.28858 type:complete len:237 (-) Transcript_32599:722-1432(-)
MGFEEIRDQLLYLHKRRDYSKRKNKFEVGNFQENISSNLSHSPSSKRSNERGSTTSSINTKSKRAKRNNSKDLPKRKKLRSSLSSDDEESFETYMPEKDPKNKARYLPPSKLKKNISNYQGRRTVKFKGEHNYNEKQYGPIKKEKKPAPKKIMCVTEIMADISDSSSSEDYEDTTSQEKPLLFSSNNSQIGGALSFNSSGSGGSDNSKQLPPDKFSFLAHIRKRSKKGREKGSEDK